MSFWTDFENAISKFAKAATAEIAVIAKNIEPLVLASAEEVAQVALQAVLAEAPKVISGQEKLNSAVSSVVTNLSSTGKSVAVSVAEAAVQSAYNTISAQISGK